MVNTFMYMILYHKNIVTLYLVITFEISRLVVRDAYEVYELVIIQKSRMIL